MDCDDVMLLLAARGQRTLRPTEESLLHHHLDDCAICQGLAEERTEDEWRWLARVPLDALDDRELPTLPTIDPVVFSSPVELAAGGMGRIIRAFDRRLGREVAIKETLDGDHGLQARFEREVRITARLQHPAIVPIYEAGVFPGGSSFYTMRLVPGRNLHDAIGDAADLEARLRLMPHLRAVADALAYAHANGVIHRDLKPGNVLVGEFGETIVIDWGLAKDTDGEEPFPDGTPRLSMPNLTRVGSVIGTPSFMSPAQAAGQSSDATDDVFALGGMLYQLLTGYPPYRDILQTSEAVIAATLDGPPTPIVELAPGAPADLRAIAERAMARDKRERYQNAGELAAELARFEAGQLLLSRDYTFRELAMRWLRKHKRAAIVAVLGVIAVIALVASWVRYQHATDELAIRERGAKVTALYTEVARQGARIDHQLLQLEKGLEGLGAAATAALTGPEPVGAEPLFTEDFADDKRRPADFGLPSAYRWQVSVQQPVIAVAPGVERFPLLPKIRRLVPLRAHIRDMVATAAGQPVPDDLDKLLRSRTSPIDYAYVDLPEGVHYVWPGLAALPADYNVLDSDFYRDTLATHGRVWGVPYIDSTTDLRGDDLVLPCTKALYSPSGDFLGVAGVEMTVTKLVRTHMALPRATLRTSLVDDKGRTLVDSSEAGRTYATTGTDKAVALRDFDIPDIAIAINGHQEGVRELQRDGKSVLVAFVRLDAIGWYYVVEIDAASL